jgi:hypothetical protein
MAMVLLARKGYANRDRNRSVPAVPRSAAMPSGCRHFRDSSPPQLDFMTGLVA